MFKRLLDRFPRCSRSRGSRAASATAVALAFGPPFIGQFNTVTDIGSTVPSNGDVNPYGIVDRAASVGSLVRGDILISNFNNSENLQGTGTTIVQVTPERARCRCSRSIDPRRCRAVPWRRRPDDGAGDPARRLRGRRQPADRPTATRRPRQAGCLIVLDSTGHVVKTISGGADQRSVGPDARSRRDRSPTLFVTNVLNGTVATGETPTDGGTVVRIGLLTLPGHAPIGDLRAGDRRRLPRAHQRSGARRRPHGRRARPRRHAVRRRHAGQPHRGGPRRAVPPDAAGQRRRHHGRQGRLPERPARADDRAQRRHPHGQRQRRQPRRDDTVRRRVPAV